jgi:hypothetical protein
MLYPNIHNLHTTPLHITAYGQQRYMDYRTINVQACQLANVKVQTVNKTPIMPKVILCENYKHKSVHDA